MIQRQVSSQLEQLRGVDADKATMIDEALCRLREAIDMKVRMENCNYKINTWFWESWPQDWNTAQGQLSKKSIIAADFSTVDSMMRARFSTWVYSECAEEGTFAQYSPNCSLRQALNYSKDNILGIHGPLWSASETLVTVEKSFIKGAGCG